MGLTQPEESGRTVPTFPDGKYLARLRGIWQSHCVGLTLTREEDSGPSYSFQIMEVVFYDSRDAVGVADTLVVDVVLPASDS